MKRLLCTTLGLLAGITVCPAQQPEQTAPIAGKPVLTLFANYKAGLGSANPLSGFNIDRAFIGYEGFLPKGFSAKIVMNVETLADADGTTRFNGYLKNAQLDWKGYGFSVSAGLVNLKQFSEQENFWGHRYVFKSFQEEYGIAFCEDIGLVAGYTFSPAVSADIALTNGEGRKFKNMDNRYKYGAGVTLTPVKGLMLRLYGDAYDTPRYLTDEAVAQQPQYTLACFIGYRHARFTLGAEYNRVYHYKFDAQRNANGYSVYATVPLTPKLHLYGRFDCFDTTGPQPYANEGQAIVCGLEYAPLPQIRISPNYQSWKAAHDGRLHYLLLSVECKL